MIFFVVVLFCLLKSGLGFITTGNYFFTVGVIMAMTVYASVQGTLILSASTVPAHFSMTGAEQFASILTLDLIRNCRIRVCGNL